MQTAQELYSKAQKKTYFKTVSNYQPILNSFGNILIQVDDTYYYGDSRVLYQQENKIGYLQFGWGSCSGCDALQSCDSIEEVQSLMDKLRSSIMWFDNPQQALAFFIDHDWDGDYSHLSTEQQNFINQAIDKLKSMLNDTNS